MIIDEVWDEFVERKEKENVVVVMDLYHQRWPVYRIASYIGWSKERVKRVIAEETEKEKMQGL